VADHILLEADGVRRVHPSTKAKRAEGQGPIVYLAKLIKRHKLHAITSCNQRIPQPGNSV
jgi:hypothetical protein